MSHVGIGTWPIGVGLAMLGSVTGTVGKQLVRYSTIAVSSAHQRRARVALVGGLCLNTFCGPVLNMFACAWAPQSILAPFGGLDIVWNMLTAPYTLGEALTPQRASGILLIFAATVATLGPGDHAEERYTSTLLHDMFLRWTVLVYALCFSVWLALNFAVLAVRPRGDRLRGFSLGVTAGSLAGNMFCLKATVELFKTAIETQSFAIYTDWLTYAVGMGAFTFAVSNVVFMTKGLQEFEALFMVTVFSGSTIVANSISACVVLREMDGHAEGAVVAYVACIACIVLGLVLLLLEPNAGGGGGKCCGCVKRRPLGLGRPLLSADEEHAALESPGDSSEGEPLPQLACRL